MATDIVISAYSIWEDLQRIRSTNPLVYNITNSVVEDFTANALLALGASPIMSDSIDETEELVAISNALNINIGTPNSGSIAAMLKAISTARGLGKPVALDPVAIGATNLRRKLVEDLLQSGNQRSFGETWPRFRFLRAWSGEAKVSTRASICRTREKLCARRPGR